MQTDTRQVTVFDPIPADARLSMVDRIRLISEQEHWGVRVIREFGPIAEPVEFDGMRYDDISKWEGYVPGVAYRRHNIITNQLNPNILQVLIGDELDNEEGHLAEPRWDLKTPRRKIKEKLDKGREQVGQVGKIALPIVAGLLAAAVAVGTILITAGIFAIAMGIEPNYVIVVEENDGRAFWVELCFWYS